MHYLFLTNKQFVFAATDQIFDFKSDEEFVNSEIAFRHEMTAMLREQMSVISAMRKFQQDQGEETRL